MLDDDLQYYWYKCLNMVGTSILKMIKQNISIDLRIYLFSIWIKDFCNIKKKKRKKKKQCLVFVFSNIFQQQNLAIFPFSYFCIKRSLCISFLIFSISWLITLIAYISMSKGPIVLNHWNNRNIGVKWVMWPSILFFNKNAPWGRFGFLHLFIYF